MFTKSQSKELALYYLRECESLRPNEYVGAAILDVEDDTFGLAVRQIRSLLQDSEALMIAVDAGRDQSDSYVYCLLQAYGYMFLWMELTSDELFGPSVRPAGVPMPYPFTGSHAVIPGRNVDEGI